MSSEWFETEFNTIRKELVEAEDEILSTEIETDFVDDVCTCFLDPELCEVHNPFQNEE